MSQAATVTLPSIAILGAGSMGQAILSGLLGPQVNVTGGIRVTSRTAARTEGLGTAGTVTWYAVEENPDANRLAVQGVRIVLIAVKPHLVPALLEEVAPALEQGAIVVSVAAGVTTATCEARLPASVVVLRAMPNTPAIVGRGVTGLSAGSRSGERDLQLVRSLFETVGTVLEVPESQLDAVSTISGSGPAYVFYLIEQLTRAAIGKGFTPEQAALLVNGTFLGSCELLAATGEEPAELRRKVTSPHGTTERAIEVLERGRLKQLFDEATDAALARARELAAG